MAEEKKSSASVFIALFIGIVLGAVLFFVYKSVTTPVEMVPAGEMMPLEENAPTAPEEVSFLESLKTSILDTFDVEGAPVGEVIPQQEEQVFFGEGEMMTEQALPLMETAPVMQSGEMLETLLDETPEPILTQSNELETMIDEPLMELKLPSTGSDPDKM
jgi:hypothetical protein